MILHLDPSSSLWWIGLAIGWGGSLGALALGFPWLMQGKLPSTVTLRVVGIQGISLALAYIIGLAGLKGLPRNYLIGLWSITALFLGVGFLLGAKRTTSKPVGMGCAFGWAASHVLPLLAYRFMIGPGWSGTIHSTLTPPEGFTYVATWQVSWIHGHIHSVGMITGLVLFVGLLVSRMNTPPV
jgi:hypothetical protein